jgi:hypothetical protein
MVLVEDRWRRKNPLTIRKMKGIAQGDVVNQVTFLMRIKNTRVKF